MELWDILDGNGNKTGRTVERGKPMRQDEYHLVVHIWMKNSKGEFLITKRTPNKETLPNMWETTVGSAVAGEDSLEAVLREAKEEISIDLSPINGKYLFRLKRQQRDFPDFIDVWIFEEEIDITKVVYQPEEVCGAKWATPSQIKVMIGSWEFADTFTYLEDLFKIQTNEVVKVVLQGEKIILVPFTIERCHAFYKDYVADPAMTYDIYTYDKEKVDRYYENKVLDTSRLFFAICHDDKIVGEIQIKRIDKEKLCGTLSIHLVNDAFKGKGYGTEAQRLLIDYAISTLGLKTIYADAVHRNHRSKHILEKLGFKYLYDDDALSYYEFSVI